jgi:hypothetical protein
MGGPSLPHFDQYQAWNWGPTAGLRLRPGDEYVSVDLPGAVAMVARRMSHYQRRRSSFLSSISPLTIA